jgi:hypothetical protein
MMKLNYQMIKDLCLQSTQARVELTRSQTQAEFDMLELFIAEVEKLDEITSKFVQLDEVQSDLEWIKLYYEQKEWDCVTRWLTNIDSSLREMWSQYIEQIVALKK